MTRTTEALQKDAEELQLRLKGVYTVPVNDGAGLLDGKDEFTREFDVPPINLEAAALISELSAKLREREWQLVKLYEVSFKCYECGDGVYSEFSDIISQIPTPPKQES